MNLHYLNMKRETHFSLLVKLQHFSFVAIFVVVVEKKLILARVHEKKRRKKRKRNKKRSIQKRNRRNFLVSQQVKSLSLSYKFNELELRLDACQAIFYI